MKRSARVEAFVFAVMMVWAVMACVQASWAQEIRPENAQSVLRGHGAREDASPKHGGAGTNLLFHNGPVLTSAAVQVIFWGTNWGNSSFVQDKISGLNLWYEGFSGSNYAQISDEYTGTNGKVGPSLTYGGYFIDTAAASGGASTSAILAEVCRVIPKPVANGYYPVYVDLPRGTAAYCAYHSYGACGSTPVQFGFFWSLDGDSGCDPQSTVAGVSQGLAALANVSGHELSEARTDPRSTAWFDNSGYENGDKCAWAFSVPYVAFPNGTRWKIQGEWSNKAYLYGQGYPNLAGQAGCLSGQ